MATNTATTIKMVEITEEVILDAADHTEAWISADENLVIVQDTSLPEDKQLYVELDAAKVKGLITFLLSCM